MENSYPGEENQIFEDTPETPLTPLPPPMSLNVPPESFLPNTPQPKKSHKRLFLFLGIFLGLAVVLGGGYLAWMKGYVSLPFLDPKIDGVIAAMVDELSGIDQARYAQTITIKLDEREEGASPLNLNSANTLNADDYLGGFSEDLDLEVTTEGIYRAGTDKSLDTELKIAGHLAGFLSEELINFAGEIRKIENNLYFIVEELSPVYVEMLEISDLINKWIQVEQESIETESGQEMEQFFEMVTYASQYELIKIKNTTDGGLIDGYQTNQVTLSFNPTKIKSWYEQTTKNIEEKFGDKAILEFDEETFQNIDGARYQELYNYLRDNLVVNLWLDKDNYIPRKISFEIDIVPPDSVTNLADKQINISFSMQLTNINEEVKIEEPAEFVTMDEFFGEAPGTSASEQKIQAQISRVGELAATLRHYKKIFINYPEDWADLKDTTNEEIDQALEVVLATSNFNNSEQYVMDAAARYLKSHLDDLVTIDHFTEKEFSYKKTETGFEFTYEISLDDVSDQFKIQTVNMSIAIGNNTANQEVNSVEYVQMIKEGDKDIDGDGLSDNQEEALGTDIDNIDTDGDGLTDYEEVITHHTDAKVKDSDGDGFDDKTEIDSGYNPNGEGKAPITTGSPQAKARDAKRISDVRTIQSALELYYNNQTTPSYPADGVSGTEGTTDIATMLNSITEIELIAPVPPDGICSPAENSYTYSSFSDVTHQTACDEEPCRHNTISYCLGGVTGDIEAGAHFACETGIACEE